LPEGFRLGVLSRQKGAVKLHTVLDYDGLLPVFVKLTDAKTHEIKVPKEMSFPKGSVVAADLQKRVFNSCLMTSCSKINVFKFLTNNKK